MLTARRANQKGVVKVSETLPSQDESLGHIEGDDTPAVACKESSGSDLNRVVGCFIHVALPPLADLPRSSDVRGVVFTDEGGTLLGHTIFTGGISETSPWPYIGIGESPPYGSQTDALSGLNIALQMQSIARRFRFLNIGQILTIGAIALGALFQLGYAIP